MVVDLKRDPHALLDLFKRFLGHNTTEKACLFGDRSHPIMQAFWGFPHNDYLEKGKRKKHEL